MIRCVFGFHNMVTTSVDYVKNGAEEITTLCKSCSRCGHSTFEIYREYYGEYTGSEGVRFDPDETTYQKIRIANGYPVGEYKESV